MNRSRVLTLRALAVSGVLVLTLAGSGAAALPAWAQSASPPPGAPGAPGAGRKCSLPTEIYRPDLGRCTCRWGSFEVGILKYVTQGDSICTFAATFTPQTGPGVILNGIVVILTVLVVMAGTASIVIGGYYYMTAGGSADRVRTAKIWIGSALIGISLALLAYTILNTISPNLV